MAGLRIRITPSVPVAGHGCNASEQRGLDAALATFARTVLAAALERAGLRFVSAPRAEVDVTGVLRGQAYCLGADRFHTFDLRVSGDKAVLAEVQSDPEGVHSLLLVEHLDSPASRDYAAKLVNAILASRGILAFAEQRKHAAAEKATRERALTAELRAAAARGAARDALARYADFARTSEPSDALRAEVITAARALSPPPAAPEEARRHAVWAMTAAKAAKSPAGYATAVSEYRAAVRHAPWWADAYMNLAIVAEQAADYESAIWALRHYLLAAPAAPDAATVRTKVYELEFKARQAAPVPEK
jgi:hypothetical protein